MAAIRTSGATWHAMFRDVELADRERAVLDLVEALERDEQERKRAEIREQPLSPARLMQFWEGFEQGWREHGILRLLLTRFDAVRFSDDAPGDDRLFGFYRAERKSWFLEGGSAAEEMGRDLGAAMARGENCRIFDGIVERATVYRPRHPSLERSLTVVSRWMRRHGCPPDVILYSGGYRPILELEGSSRFVRGQERSEGIIGAFDGIPMYQIKFTGEARFVLNQSQGETRRRRTRKHVDPIVALV